MNFVLKVMIITLSSIDRCAEKSASERNRELPDKHWSLPKPCGKHPIPCGFPRSAKPFFDTGLLLVSPVVTLAEAAEYPLEDFSHDPEYGDYHYYFHTAIYFYLIVYLLKYATTQLNNYIII